MATRAAICAADWMPFRFPRWRNAFGRSIFVPGGKPAEAPYPLTPMHQRDDLRKVVELCIVSNFVEVFLAKEGHKNPVGINFLEKVQMPHLPSIYGAMLAGVGYVLMGAGIPLHIPGVLDGFAAHHAAEYKLSVRAPRRIRIRRCASIRPTMLKAPADASSAEISGYRLLEHPGHHHAASGYGSSGWAGD